MAAVKECVKALRCVGEAHSNFCPAYVPPQKPKDTGDPIIGTAQPAPAKFDQPEGERRRDAGIDRAADGRAELMAAVREGVRDIARKSKGREVTADDAQAWLIANGHAESALGNAAGAIFRGDPHFECTGKTIKSKRTEAQARRVMVWRLKVGPR